MIKSYAISHKAPGCTMINSGCHWLVPHAPHGTFIEGHKRMEQHATQPSALVAHCIDKRAALTRKHLVINASRSLSSQCIGGQA